MPVFDFSNDTSEIKEEVVCTYLDQKIHHRNDAPTASSCLIKSR